MVIRGNGTEGGEGGEGGQGGEERKRRRRKIVADGWTGDIKGSVRDPCGPEKWQDITSALMCHIKLQVKN